MTTSHSSAPLISRQPAVPLQSRPEQLCDASINRGIVTRSRPRHVEHSWLDLCDSWLPGHAETFDALLRDAPWQQRERWMYERKVLEPRLVASWSGDALGDSEACAYAGF